MRTVCKEDACNGCMLCTNICVKNAIKVVDNLNAVNAVIDEDRCINCGKCTRLCPQNNDIPMNKPISWKQGWSQDPEIRSKSSSGGLATAIALSFYGEGGSCVSCSFSNGNFDYSLAKNEDEILHFRGSKYVKSNPNCAYRLIKDEISQKRKVLFIGLPCQVAGIKNYIGDSDYLYTIDLICHGSPSKSVLDLFLKENGYDLYKMSDISFRRKSTLLISTNGKPITKSGNRDLYMRYFLKKLFYTENCYDCHFSQLQRCSDLTLGDSWGSELSEEEINKGISLVLCNTDKGLSLIESCSLHLEDVDINKAILANTNLSHPSISPPERTKFFEYIRKKNSFNYAIKKCYPQFYYKFLLRELINRKTGGGGT